MPSGPVARTAQGTQRLCPGGARSLFRPDRGQRRRDLRPHLSLPQTASLARHPGGAGGLLFPEAQGEYRDNLRLVFENLAISDRDEVRDFYRIREGIDYLPSWCDGLGTFHREVLLSHRWAIPAIEDYVVTEQVHCVSLADLLAKHAVERLDLLSIDTEGHDYTILQQIDFDRLKPSLILYEHQYIDPADRACWEEKLRGLGYALTRHLGNTLAFLPQPPPFLPLRKGEARRG